jgi:hypothetical protein
MNLVYAWVGDLEASRQAPERPRLADELRRILEDLARRWPDDWLAPPVMVRGIDEISGALASPERAFDAAVRLNVALWPARFRVAVSSGEIDVGWGSADASVLDGSAFHRAADALGRAEANRIPFAIHLEGVDVETAGLVECLAALHGRGLADRSPAQAGVAALYRELGTQQAVARARGISQQAVSKSLRAGRETELRETEDVLRAWLARRPRTTGWRPAARAEEEAG